MNRTASLHRRRTLLALTTAMSGLSAGPVLAQGLPAPVLPTDRSVIRTDASVPGLAPQVTNPNANRLDVRLRAQNTVIDWNGFNVPTNAEAHFDTTVALDRVPVAVLNRDLNGNGNVSQILGRLTSSDNVAVWVYNPNGILVGPGARITTGSLVLSALDVTNTDFLRGGPNYRLATSTPDSMAAISVVNGARITVEGGTRGLVMVAPKIDADGQFTATGQDVAFVTASDVTLTYTTGSPLSVTLNRGTAVAGTSQIVRGTVAGDDALFALASQGQVTDALLQVDASVTTALSGTRGIVLSAGRPAAGVSGVSVATAPMATDGIAGIEVNGALTTLDTDGGSDILAAASGAARFAGALTTDRDVALASGGALSVSDGVRAGRDYLASGTGVTLGGGSAVTQRANGRVSVQSTDGDIVGLTGLTLRSGASGGTAGIGLGTNGTTAGDIRFAPGTTLAAGTERSADLTLTLRDAANSISLGNVTARSLRGAIGSGNPANGLSVASALVLGDVDVQQSLLIGAAGVEAGTLRSGGSITIASTGDVTAAGLTAANGSVALTGTGATTLTGAVSATGNGADVSILRDGAVALGSVSATRDVRIGGATTVSAAISGPVTAGRDYVVLADNVTLGGAVPVLQRADGAVRIEAGTAITGLSGLTLRADANLQGGETLTLAATGAGSTIAFAPATSLVGGGATQGSDIRIRSGDAAGMVTLGNVTGAALLGAVGTDAFAPGLIRDTAISVGDVTLASALVLGGARIDTGTLRTTGGVSLTATADGIATGAITATGAVLADAAGAVVVGGDVAAGGALTLRGASVALGGARAVSGGAIDLLARSGGIASTGALALQSTSTRSADFIRLQATGPEGISFASGSAITGGTDRALRVAVFNGTADAPLSLGNVTARSLGALATADGNANARPGAIVTDGDLRFGTLDLVDGFSAESTGGDLSVQRIAVTGAGQGIRLIAGTGTLSVQNDITASGDVTLTSGTGLTLGTVESRDGAAALLSGGAIRLNRLSGLTGAAATGTRLSIDIVTGGAVRLVATAGNAALGSVTGDAITIDAAGTLDLSGDVRAAGDVALSAGGPLTLGTVESRTGRASATSGGAVRLTALSGASAAEASGTSLSIDSVTGGSVRLAATDGDAAFGTIQGTGVAVDAAGSIGVRGTVAGRGTVTLDAGRDLTVAGLVSTTAGGLALSAGGLADIRGGTDGAGDIGIAGATVLIGGAQRAGGAYRATAGAGGITGAAGLTITSDADGVGGEELSLVGSGGVALDRGSRLRGGRDAGSRVSVMTDGAAVTLGGVTADALAIGSASGPVAAITAGDLTVGSAALQATNGIATGIVTARGTVAIDGGTGLVSTGAVTTGGTASLLGGALQFGRVEAAALTAVASTGNLVGGDVVVGGAATLRAGGTLDIGRITATQGNVDLTSSGRLFATGVDAGGTATLITFGRDADIVVRDGLSARGDVTVTSTGDIASPFIRSVAGDLTIAAPDGGIGGFTPGSGIALSVSRDRAFSLSVGAAARLGDVRTGALTINATEISAGSVDTGGEALTLNATAGDLVLGGPVTGGAVSLGATGRLQIAAVTASGALALSGGSGLTFTDAAGSSIVATSGGALTGRTVRSVGDVRVTGGSLALAGASGRDVSLAATNGDASLGTLDATGDASFSAVGASRITGNARAAGALRLSGGTSLTFADATGGTISARSDGAIQGASAVAAGDVGIAGGSLSLGTVNGRTLTLTASRGDAVLDRLTASADATLTAAGAARVRGDAAAAGAFALVGTTALDFDRITGGTVSLRSNGLVTGTTAQAGGDLTASGAALTITRATGRDLTLTAAGGDATLGSFTARGDASVNASGTARIAETSAAQGALTVRGNTGVGFADLSGGTVMLDSAGAIGGNAVRATGTLQATGASLTLAQGSAGGALTLAAMGGDANLGILASGGTAAVSASGTARVTGAVVAGGDYRVTGASVSLGGGSVVQTAAGAVRITSLAGDIAGAAGLTLRSDSDASAGAESLVLDSAGGIALAGTRLQARAGGGAALGLRAGSARAVTLGDVEAGLIAGFDGTRVAGTFTHDGGFTAGDVVASDLGVTLSGGDLAIGRLAATGTVALRAGTVSLGDVGAGTLDLTGSRSLTVGRLTATGAATLGGGTITTGDVRGAAVTVRTTGALGGVGAGRPSLTATGGDVTVEAGTARLGGIESAGAVTLAADTIDVAGRLSAARRLLAEARNALTAGDARAGDTLTLRSGGQLTAGSLDAGGALSATGAGVALAGARSGGSLTLSSTRDLSLGSGTAAGAVTVEATGLATLGAVAAGPAITVTAGDVALGGPVSAAAVTFANRAPATATRLGDGTSAGGFSLSAAEIGRVAADSLRVDAGAGQMEIGTLALAPTTGRQVELLSTGDIRVTGALSATGTGRSVRIGGDATNGSASTIHVAATGTGGGRLLMDGVDLELRGNRIAVGLATGFIDTLVPGEAGRAQAANLLGNANSPLYNAQLGGGFFDPSAATTLAARTLTLRFGDYALIQNTALPGQQSGVVLGGTLAQPVNPALRVSSSGSAAASQFALFGTINGVSGAAAALLGSTTLDIDPLLLPNSRINGCLAGTGAGCLTTIVIQPTLQVFDWDSEDVFGIIQDVAVPFAPSVGGNNEELLTGLPALAPEAQPQGSAR